MPLWAEQENLFFTCAIEHKSPFSSPAEIAGLDMGTIPISSMAL